MNAPRDPESAFILASLFKMVGGAFVIDSNGRRCIVSDLDQSSYRLRVSIMVEGLMERLCEADKAFIFDAFADCAIDPDNITTVADEPMRRAA